MQIEVASLKCPNCGAALDEKPSHGELVCAYCGSHLRITGLDDEQGSDEETEQGPEQFDSVEELVKSYCLSLQQLSDDDGGDLLFVDEDLAGEEIHDKAIKNLGLPANETCYLIYDNTIMGSCKAGYAITDRGLYYSYNKTGRGSMDWQQYAGNQIKRHRKDDAHIRFSDGTEFNMDCSDFTETVHAALLGMQEQLTAQFFSK